MQKENYVSYFKNGGRKMRLLIIGLILVSLISPCFAGAYVKAEKVEKAAVVSGITKGEVANMIKDNDSYLDNKIDSKIDERMKSLKSDDKKVASEGLSLGLYGDMASLKYTNFFGINTEIGGVAASNQAGRCFAKMDMNLFSSPLNWSVCNTGLTAFMTELGTPAYGWFVGLKRNLVENIAVSFDLYPIVCQDTNWSSGNAVIGAQWYF